MAEDPPVIMSLTTKNKVGEFTGVFGMSNLDKLALEMSEYAKKDSKI